MFLLLLMLKKRTEQPWQRPVNMLSSIIIQSRLPCLRKNLADTLSFLMSLCVQDRIYQLFAKYVSTTEASNMLRCLKAKVEAPGVMTFEFEISHPEDTDEGNVFADPGQFASFDFQEITPGKTLNRTWTISSPQHIMAEEGVFSITVKKVWPPRYCSAFTCLWKIYVCLSMCHEKIYCILLNHLLSSCMAKYSSHSMQADTLIIKILPAMRCCLSIKGTLKAVNQVFKSSLSLLMTHAEKGYCRLGLCQHGYLKIWCQEEQSTSEESMAISLCREFRQQLQKQACY